MVDVTTLFLASSITEFKRERASILSFENDLQSVLWESRYRILFESCDGMNDFMVGGGTQSSLIDPKILECDYFLLLAGRAINPATEHEVDLALKNGKKILALFKRLQPSEIDQNVNIVRDRLRNSGKCTFANFCNADDIKREIIRYINDELPLPFKIALQDNVVSIE